MDAIEQQLTALIDKLSNPAIDAETAHKCVNKSLRSIKESEKSIHHNISKLAKQMPRPLQFGSVIAPPTPESNAQLESAIVRHLLHAGLDDVAQELAQESPLLIAETLPIDEYRQLWSILTDIDQDRLDIAIEWAGINRAFLRQLGSSLEFDLYVLRFSNLLNHDRAMAIEYLRTSDIIQINPKAASLSLALVGESMVLPSTTSVKRGFEWAYLCKSHTSPVSQLELAASAGLIALPELARSQSLIKARNAEWTSLGELPVEIDLPQELCFHPIFVCPVSKEQTTASNPPCLLPCGHIIARSTVHSLRNTSLSKRIFKCPYCPESTTLEKIDKVAF